eukprot:TRINITY_DN721_c0_g1_i1.p1 TRINITY_DN721_c0_g1~~TRINITY_DN721_c0_g1_i1.p1  ORF type:complete len:752 (+),score=107.44 TRINITY_DN721_c0_g1_i1:330-2258(+)
MRKATDLAPPVALWQQPPSPSHSPSNHLPVRGPIPDEFDEDDGDFEDPLGALSATEELEGLWLSDGVSVYEVSSLMRHQQPGTHQGHPHLVTSPPQLLVQPSVASTQPIEHPLGEHPSRTLFVRNINSNVDDEELRLLFEQFGEIRTMYTACKHRGFVMISYFDIRNAKTAMRMLQGKQIRRRKIDIHYSIPKDHPSERDQNQGTLVVFNLDPSISNHQLRLIFSDFGEVKEVRETPNKKHHKFIEFYDIRHADHAMRSLNKAEIMGKRIKIELSRPGGARVRADGSEDLTSPPMGLLSPFGTGAPLSPNYSPTFSPSYPSGGLGAPLSPSQQTSPQWAPRTHSSGSSPASILATPPFEVSTTAPQARFSPFFSPPTQNLQQPPSLSPQPPRSFPSAMSFSSHQQQQQHHQTPFYFPQGSESADFQGGEFSAPFVTQPLHVMHQISSPQGELLSAAAPLSPSTMPSLQAPQDFSLSLDRIRSGEDSRTTLMIRNIPNKYTQRMLLATIDEVPGLRGSYDFFYLPIDFKNKCNVGYAFINLLSQASVLQFYSAFQGARWEKFNSDKVCEVAYARIQGREALIAHFNHSPSVLGEDRDRLNVHKPRTVPLFRQGEPPLESSATFLAPRPPPSRRYSNPTSPSHP